jgi:hypothetical protein
MKPPAAVLNSGKADSVWPVSTASDFSAGSQTPRHAVFVRVTHWITALCLFALLLSRFEIVISHPRFYWGETGNVLTPALFKIPTPERLSFLCGPGTAFASTIPWS